MDVVVGKRVLDMGTGTGVLALLAATLGAEKVTATDISPKAVVNAALNTKRLGLGHIVDVKGPANLFDAVQGEVYDTILFNAPWIHGMPQTLYDSALYDPDHRVIDGFMQTAADHLSPDGTILLQYSDISQRTGGTNADYLRELIARNGFRIEKTRSIARVSRALGSSERVSLFLIRRSDHGVGSQHEYNDEA